MISVLDYTKEDGTTDWAAYNQAWKDDRREQVNKGHYCCSCGVYLVLAAGYRTQCSDCQRMLRDDCEVTHEQNVRCPDCSRTMNVSEHELYVFGLYEEGEHEVRCDDCGHSFTVTTELSYHFTSPALNVKKDEDEDEQDEDAEA
jgi:hypothetical protein